jgi:hypothetical protein
LELLEWLEAAADASQEIATGPLGATATSWRECSNEALPGDLCGVYIPLISDDLALQFGMLASRDVCIELARSLLGMTADEELGSDEDIFDAVGEVSNLVAGGVKVRLADRCNVNLGVPLALQGRVFPASGSRSAQGVVRVGDSDVWLVMTGTPRKAKPH